MYFRRIEDLRIDHDLTQQQIADILGCKREVYRRYEKGTRTIPIDFLIKLADLYEVSVDYFLILLQDGAKHYIIYDSNKKRGS